MPEINCNTVENESAPHIEGNKGAMTSLEVKWFLLCVIPLNLSALVLPAYTTTHGTQTACNALFSSQKHEKFS